jgi:DNA primase large subunit
MLLQTYQMASKMDIMSMAKYPYIKETVDHIRDTGPSIADLNTSSVYQSVRALGKERVLTSLKDHNISESTMVTDSDALKEILSYIIARILVSSVKSHFLIRRYALAEAKLMNERLLNEPTEITLVISGELGIAAEQDGSNISLIKLDVTDYLRHSSGFKSDEWKLVNQDLKNGQITLERRKFIRLLQHAMQVKIEGELPLPVSDEIISNYKDEINEIKSLLGSLKKKYEVKDFGKLDLNRLPPCMKQILAMAQSGENLSHSARFSITAFLHTIGLSSTEILKIFGTSPDFDASIARYQIEHITGEGSGTEYVPPSCAKMKSYGICYNPDGLCKKEWMSHPLKYYRIKGKSREEPASKDGAKGKKGRKKSKKR